MSMLTFTKMQGLGNDFMVIESFTQSFTPDAERIRQWSDRRFGVGFDQLLWLSPAQDSRHVACYRIFNADGTEAMQCGNGARCIGRFLVDRGYHTGHDPFTVEMLNGDAIQIQQISVDQYAIEIGVPEFLPQNIPFDPTDATQVNVVANQQNQYQVSIEECGKRQDIQFGVVSLGNPHAVIFVEDLQTTPVAEWGAYIQHLTAFPEQVNVGFAERTSEQQIKLRVFERGSGETLACGTGACAAMVIGRQLGLLDSTVMVEQQGGKSQISWKKEGDSVSLVGPAEDVFQAQLSIA